MGKYIMVAQSRAKEGREDEYLHWYDTEHLADVCSVPGITSGRRFDVMPEYFGQPGSPYFAVYEIDADDPGAVMAELLRRTESGEISMTDAIDMDSANMWIYKPS